MTQSSNRQLAEMYRTCRDLAAAGKFAENAEPGQMYGIAHKAYWNGRNNTGKRPQPGSLAYAAWAAGRDDRPGAPRRHRFGETLAERQYHRSRL